VAYRAFCKADFFAKPVAGVDKGKVTGLLPTDDKAECVNENETYTPRPTAYEWSNIAAVGHGLHSTLYGFRSGHAPPPLQVRINPYLFQD